MNKYIPLVLALLLICGCGKNSDKQVDGTTSHEAGTAASVTETAAQDMTVTDAPAETDDSEILLLWKKDITLQDTFVPTQSLNSFPYKEITVPASDAEAVAIRTERYELHSDRIDTSEGDVSSEYIVTVMDEEIQEEYDKIWSELRRFNEFSRQNAILEISEGETRYKAYRRSATDHSDLFLTSRTGIELKRTDSGILSYFRTVYRSNRGFEPDYYELYGRTIDSASGRVLSLNDILTDTSGLPQMIWGGLVESGQREDDDPDKEEFLMILDEAIQGCRDDGSFGWALDPFGIEFGLIESEAGNEMDVHKMERVFIPFSMCEEILRPGISELSCEPMEQTAEEN